MIITLENDQDKLQISEELEQLLTAGLNVVARLHSLSERTEVDITIVDDEEIHMPESQIIVSRQAYRCTFFCT